MQVVSPSLGCTFVRQLAAVLVRSEEARLCPALPVRNEHEPEWRRLLGEDVGLPGLDSGVRQYPLLRQFSQRRRILGSDRVAEHDHLAEISQSGGLQDVTEAEVSGWGWRTGHSAQPNLKRFPAAVHDMRQVAARRDGNEPAYAN